MPIPKRTIPLSFCLIALTSLASADILTIEVTINSVDAKESMIAATRKGRTLELEVSKSAEVIIDGKAGDLSALTSGQKAKIDYETNLGIITKIEVADPDSARPALVELAELNTGTYTVDPWISPDGMTIYWTFEGTIWTAQRKDTRALFENKRKLARGRHATVTADGLRIVMLGARSDGQKGESLYEAERSSVDDSFSRPREIREFRDEPSPKSPCLSEDVLTLYFTRIRNQRAEFAFATRKSQSDPWSPARLLPVDAGNIDARLTWAFVMNDGLNMLCSAEGLKGAGDTGSLLMLSRKSKIAPFENPQFIAAEGLAPLTGRAARYVPATGEIVFARSVRQKEFSLWMVKNLDLDMASAAK